MIMLHTKLTLFAASYILYIKPFKERSKNLLNAFNEWMIIILSYFYMFFLQSSEKDEFFGKLYVKSFLLCMGINAINVVYTIMVPTLKGYHRSYKNKKR